MQETWKDIVGYEGLYQVSSDGQIKALDKFIKCGFGGHRFQKEIIMKKPIQQNGYMQVMLYKSGKYRAFSVHRLVALTFISNPDCCPEVNHKDENKQNNKADNLEWCTSSYNSRYGTRIDRWRENTDFTKVARACSKQVKQIDKQGNVVKVWSSATECFRVGHYSQGNVSACCRGEAKTAYGYRWEYAG